MHKIWIHGDWYIPVDEQGYCVGPCFEGALGFVIQLRLEGNDSSHKALKIPKLLGETYRENAYICELSQKELKAVQTVFEGVEGKSCLLEADVVNSVLRTPISTKGGVESAQDWDGALVSISCEKGRNPRFCLVKADGDKIVKFPNIEDCPINSKKTLDSIRESSIGREDKNPRPWKKTVLISVKRKTDKETEAKIFPVNDSLNDQASKNTWYICLPGIVYSWAAGTLQETISLGTREDWSLEENLKLIERVCRALVSLHARGMLHADVRPANIVFQGDPTDPNSYYLADYGSFSENIMPKVDREPTGETVLGPVKNGERMSVFYAPERRSGREREAADTAVVYKPDGSKLYLVLGWRSDLIDKESGKPKDEIIETIKSLESQDDVGNSKETHNKTSWVGLEKGDRLQIRDYIFEVDGREYNIGNRQILECKSKFWQVYQGRIVVETEDHFDEVTSFPIPRTIELLKWSASIDLYSGTATINPSKDS